MNISPNEAEENLAAIQNMMIKTRRAIASSGTYITVIVTGFVWLIGFSCTQFLPREIVGYIWTGLSILGGALGSILGFRMGKRVRSPLTAVMVKRIGIFWLLLACYCLATIAVAWPLDGKQASVLIALFILLGQLAMGLPFPFASSWWVLPITALMLIGYFLLPAFFYLWMGILGGGGMIAIAFYIRSKW